MSIDLERARRETMRWYILVALNAGRPNPVAEGIALTTLQAIPIQCTLIELRRELDYLEARGLVELHRMDIAPWSAEVTRAGVDVVEYTVPVNPGIARPVKYY